MIPSCTLVLSSFEDELSVRKEETPRDVAYNAVIRRYNALHRQAMDIRRMLAIEANKHESLVVALGELYSFTQEDIFNIFKKE